ncbi:putative ribonuclease H-like domain-containing protein [Tanacetum coccineum]
MDSCIGSGWNCIGISDVPQINFWFIFITEELNMSGLKCMTSFHSTWSWSYTETLMLVLQLNPHVAKLYLSHLGGSNAREEFCNSKTPTGKVYKVVKALYGLHQAPRAWYETLANNLLGNRFKRGKIDQTLFIKKQKGDILLVMYNVDDIIFGSINKELCTAFEKLMKDKFQMSSMRELTFFLGLQVTHNEDGIFISQDKYVAEILKKFNNTDVKSASTPVDLEKPLVKDGDVDDVDVLLINYDCVFDVFSQHLGNDIMDSPFELVAYTNSDYAGATQDRKSTTGGCQFLGNRLISWLCKKQTMVAASTTKAEYMAAASCCGRMERVATTASSLEAEQDSDNINRTQSMATLNEPNP